MSKNTKEEKVLFSVIENKDVFHIIGEDPALFGEYADAFQWLRDYYLRYKTVPTVDIMTENFPDVEPFTPDGPTKHYVDDLKSSYVKRNMNSILLETADRLKKENPATVLEEVTTKLARITKFTATANDLNITDIDSAIDHFDKLKEKTNANGGTPGITTGFDGFDAAYPTGLAGGHLIVAMGYTGRGKSLFCNKIAERAWQQGYHPMIVSLEMSPEEQRERIYAIMAAGKFRQSDLARGDVDEKEMRAWAEKEFKERGNFTIVSNVGSSEITPNVVQAKIDTHQPDLVIYDYAQLGMDNAKTQAMTPRMLNFSREMKLLATSNDIPVVMVTAVTDDENDKRDGPPTLDQVAWSRGIEYDANLALAIHRYDDSNMVEVACRKNRNGPLFNIAFDVDFDHGIWMQAA